MTNMFNKCCYNLFVTEVGQTTVILPRVSPRKTVFEGKRLLDCFSWRDPSTVTPSFALGPMLPGIRRPSLLGQRLRSVYAYRNRRLFTRKIRGKNDGRPQGLTLFLFNFSYQLSINLLIDWLQVHFTEGVRVLDLSQDRQWEFNCTYGQKRPQFAYLPWFLLILFKFFL